MCHFKTLSVSILSISFLEGGTGVAACGTLTLTQLLAAVVAKIWVLLPQLQQDRRSGALGTPGHQLINVGFRLRVLAWCWSSGLTRSIMHLMHKESELRAERRLCRNMHVRTPPVDKE